MTLPLAYAILLSNHKGKNMSKQSNREKSLEWWAELDESEQRHFASIHLPNISFICVSTSLLCIEKIWKKEKDRLDTN